MFKIFDFFKVISTFLIATMISAMALAQSTILVVDQNKILRDSEVGKHIQRQLDSIAKTMKSEIDALAPPQSEVQSLQNELKTMTSMQDLQARPDIQSRLQTAQAKSQKQQIEARIKSQELKITEAKSIQKVNEKLKTILQQIVTERNADVVLDRSLVIYGQPADVTDVVMSRLNSQLKTVPVSRERLPRKN